MPVKGPANKQTSKTTNQAYLGTFESMAEFANTPAVFARHGVFIAREVFDRA
jgi:hypothetical protein